MKLNQTTPDREKFITLAAGRIRCSRCQALSKRTKRQCGSPAIRGKRCCRLHGGVSRGPTSIEGRKRCGIAKTVHGGETRAIRAARPAKMAELKVLEKIIEKW